MTKRGDGKEVTIRGDGKWCAVVWAALMLCGTVTQAADYAAAAREVWTGTYRCGPMGESPGYTSSITMRIEGGAANIYKESAQIRETLSGQVAADGTLRLQGAGARKSGGPVWRYRYDGRFEGARFNAQGEMLSSASTHLRDCSMTLTRSSASSEKLARGEVPKPEPVIQKPPEPAVQKPPEAAAPKPVAKAPESARPAEKPKAAEPVPPKTASAPASKAAEPVPAKVADVLIPVQTDAKPLLPRAPGTVDPLQKEIDLNDRNDVAVMEATVARGIPHRYLLDARKGQVLVASLRADGGARFDLYEPGSTLTLLSGGFVVQGSRLGETDQGTELKVELPEDGKYLLVVRALKDKSFYALDVAVDGGTGSVGEHWRRNRMVWIVLLLCAAALAAAFLIRRKRDRRLFRSG
ncbi:MAG TPA: hypothetical protein VED01_01680 [Burkholderiales bacterium]|nr:hypothetical protein [Burkholderiales bacterium]